MRSKLGLGFALAVDVEFSGKSNTLQVGIGVCAGIGVCVGRPIRTKLGVEFAFQLELELELELHFDRSCGWSLHWNWTSSVPANPIRSKLGLESRLG